MVPPQYLSDPPRLVAKLLRQAVHLAAAAAAGDERDRTDTATAAAGEGGEGRDGNGNGNGNGGGGGAAGDDSQAQWIEFMDGVALLQVP